MNCRSTAAFIRSPRQLLQSDTGVWAVFHAKDYLPKPTVVYFLRLRRGTSQHQTRETNAGGGGVRRNTRRVKPTPEEEGYVATQDA